MAEATTVKATNLARELVQASDGFMAALETLAQLAAEQDGAGIDFTAQDVEDALAADAGLMHVTGADLNAVITTSVAVRQWLDANFHTAVYQKARP